MAHLFWGHCLESAMLHSWEPGRMHTKQCKALFTHALDSWTLQHTEQVNLRGVLHRQFSEIRPWSGFVKTTTEAVVGQDSGWSLWLGRCSLCRWWNWVHLLYRTGTGMERTLLELACTVFQVDSIAYGGGSQEQNCSGGSVDGGIALRDVCSLGAGAAPPVNTDNFPLK